MLGTMLTFLYLMVKATEQLCRTWVRPEPLPYMVSQPLPWQVQCVSQSRRGSKVDESDGQTEWRRNSRSGLGKNSTSSNGHWATSGPASPDKAAATIQSQFRKHQQKKQKDGK